MAKIAKPETGAFVLTVDEPMLGCLHDMTKFVEGKGKELFREYLRNIYDPQPVSDELIEQYTTEFHNLLHRGMAMKAGLIPNGE